MDTENQTSGEGETHSKDLPQYQASLNCALPLGMNTRLGVR